MERLRSLWADHPYYVAGVVSVALGYVIYRKYLGSKERPTVVCPPNTVLLCQFARGPYAPSMSNFPMKLETYLKMANIPYFSNCCGKFSPKGKTPFMIYNGEVVSDSQFCIEYLNKKLSVDLNKTLSAEERAVAKAIQAMVDEHLYWTLVYFRWVYDRKLKMATIGFPQFKYILWLIRRGEVKKTITQGIGRHTPDEIKHILVTGLQALSDYLGNKPFLMGQVPSEVDCSAFGLLAQFVWHSEDDVCKSLVQVKFPTLYDYCLRMKARFWPDWDDCITHGGTRPATK